MNFNLVVLLLLSKIDNDLVSTVISFLRNYDINGCINCNISWYSNVENKIPLLCNTFIYPIILWNNNSFIIKHVCSKKCYNSYKLKELLDMEKRHRDYIEYKMTKRLQTINFLYIKLFILK